MKYMNNFRARMPRLKLNERQSYIVLSVKDSKGNRAEYEGTISKEDSAKILDFAVKLIHKKND